MRELIKLYLNEVVHNKLNLDTFITRSKESHGDKYDYSLIEFKNTSTKVKIICSKHGIFESTPSNHFSKSCRKCHFESLYSNTDDFIRKSSTYEFYIYINKTGERFKSGNIYNFGINRSSH